MKTIETLLEERRNLCGERVTLNGKPACISGARCDFASVRTLDLMESVQFSWDAVKRIVAKGGEFRNGKGR